jgi:hypothetical protein
MKLRPGRPPGPSAGRGPRPWDPISLGFREQRILDYIATNPDEPRWMVAQRFAISLSRLSIITCSPAGVQYLATAAPRWGLPGGRPDPLEDL